MLRVVVGVSETRTESIRIAVDSYNAIEGHKYFLSRETVRIDLNTLNQSVYQTEIFFNLETFEDVETNEFIGSTEVSPEDPDWHDKLYGPVSLPDSSGWTEVPEVAWSTSNDLSPLRIVPVEKNQ